MGIKGGILQHLKPLLDLKVSLAEFRGQTVGVDVSAFLHRSVVKDPWGLLMDKLDALASVKRYYNRIVEIIKYYGLTAIYVFDGFPLPAV